MKKEYDKKFNQEIERILNEVYHKSIVKSEMRYIEYLTLNELITIRNRLIGSRYDLLLSNKGYEVFEKFHGWNDYKKKVIDKKHKVENAKDLAQRFWWLPILISVIALGFSVWAILKK